MQSQKRFTDDQVQRIRREYLADEDLTCTALAEKYEVAVVTMANLLKGSSYPQVPGAVTIRIHKGRGNFRMPREKRNEIFRLLKAGRTTNSIAAEVGCSTSHVHHIRKRNYDYLK